MNFPLKFETVSIMFMRYYLYLLLLLCSNAALAQQSGKTVTMQQGNKTYSNETQLTKIKGKKYQRKLADMNVQKIIAGIPRKDYPIVIETFSNDEESITLKKELTAYLKKQGYTNFRNFTQALFGSDFKYKECTMAVLYDPDIYDIFIAPCNKMAK